MTHRKVILAMVAVILVVTVPVTFDLAFRGLHQLPADPVWDVPDSDIDRGREAILAHGCGGCHVIPGVRTATGRVGPQLIGLREQTYIAGVLANTPDNLIAWIMVPQDINPMTAMPNLEVSAQEARDIAAYLYAHPRERQWPRLQPPSVRRER
jgi:mono/diheme cytochrome c family protein